jgi:hypothetical protein
LPLAQRSFSLDKGYLFPFAEDELLGDSYEIEEIEDGFFYQVEGKVSWGMCTSFAQYGDSGVWLQVSKPSTFPRQTQPCSKLHAGTAGYMFAKADANCIYVRHLTGVTYMQF